MDSLPRSQAIIEFVGLAVVDTPPRVVGLLKDCEPDHCPPIVLAKYFVQSLRRKPALDKALLPFLASFPPDDFRLLRRRRMPARAKGVPSPVARSQILDTNPRTHLCLPENAEFGQLADDRVALASVQGNLRIWPENRVSQGEHVD